MGTCFGSSFVKTFKHGRVLPPKQSFEREMTIICHLLLVGSL